MTEPTPEPTESTMEIVEEVPPPSTEQPLVPNAPGYVALSPYYGQQAAAIQWGPPVEGAADGYTVEADGKSMDVAGDVFRIDMGGLQPGQTLVATVTAHIGGQSGSLSTEAVIDALPAPEPEPAPEPAPADPPQEG